MSTAEPHRKGTKRERTRAALVAAALEVLSEKGFAGASNQAIAARAGMTKGAIYSNFASKAELLLAAMAAKGLTLSGAPRAPDTLAAELAAMAGELARMIQRARGDAALLAEFQLHALADPELRAGLAATYAESFGATAGYLAALKDAPAHFPPRDLAVALQAIALGFLAQSFLTPDEISPRLIQATLAALARGLAAP